MDPDSARFTPSTCASTARRQLSRLRGQRARAGLIVALLVAGGAVATGCQSTHHAAPPVPVPASGPAFGAQGAPSADPLASASPTGPASAAPAVAHAPASALAVGVRTISLSRGASRPLPTTIWYPAAGAAGGSPKTNAPAAAGRYPLILFSHGFTSLPASYAAGTTRLAAAGFVVAAPAYPGTSANANPFNAADLVNQPADASFVITEVLKLDTRAGDLLAGHLDGQHIAAAGHSGGGYTTAGLLGSARDSRLDAAVIIAGGMLGGYTGPKTPTLFVHGDQDPTVPYSTGRDAYTRMVWPKGFLTEIGAGHSDYLNPANKGFAPMLATILDFLRWTLYADQSAKSRLTKDAAVANTTRLDSTW